MSPKRSFLRGLVVARRAASACLGGALYGAVVCLTGFYGLVSWVVLTCCTTLFAVACAIYSRE